MVVRVFRHEVERQTKFGLLAAQDLDSALGTGDTDRVWYSIQSLLIAAGNVSRLLWPTRQGIPGRGEELRNSLSVPDDSPLQARTFRNHFEHFDERLEQWAASSKRKNFVDSNIGALGMIRGIDPDDFLRNFDSTAYAVTFRGDRYSLTPLINALRELHQCASDDFR